MLFVLVSPYSNTRYFVLVRRARRRYWRENGFQWQWWCQRCSIGRWWPVIGILLVGGDLWRSCLQIRSSEIDIDLWEMQGLLVRQLVAHVGGAWDQAGGRVARLATSCRACPPLLTCPQRGQRRRFFFEFLFGPSARRFAACTWLAASRRALGSLFRGLPGGCWFGSRPCSWAPPWLAARQEGIVRAPFGA